MSKNINHKIMLKEVNGNEEFIYNNVIWCEGLYGCLIRLHMDDGSTATLDKDNWYMFDLTPTLGWNDHATDILES